MLQLVVILVSGLIAAAVRLGRRVSLRIVAGLLMLSVAVSVAGVLAGARLYPWTDIPVAMLAVNGGILLARAIPPRFWPFFLALLILSALDAAQQVLPSGPVSHSSTRPVAYFYTMFVIDVGGGHAAIGFLDLLLAAAVGEHSRRRGQSPWRGILPAPAGVLLADLLVRLTSAGNIPLIPFITLAWLIVQLSWPQRTAKPVVAA